MTERPSFEITLGNEEFEATPDNTILYTFLGQSAINGVLMDNSRFDHVYFKKGDIDKDTWTGSYVHRTERTAKVYDEIVSVIVQLGFPMVLNRWDVPECDVIAYFRCLDQLASVEQADDFFPDDWSSSGK